MFKLLSMERQTEGKLIEFFKQSITKYHFLLVVNRIVCVCLYYHQILIQATVTLSLVVQTFVVCK